MQTARPKTACLRGAGLLLALAALPAGGVAQTSRNIQYARLPLAFEARQQRGAGGYAARGSGYEVAVDGSSARIRIRGTERNPILP